MYVLYLCHTNYKLLEFMIKLKQEFDSMQFRNEERSLLSRLFSRISSIFSKCDKVDNISNQSIIVASMSADADELSQKIISETCSEIDLYHDTLGEFIKDNPDSPSDWAKQKLFQFAKEQNPSLTIEEKNEISDMLEKIIENQTLQNVELLGLESHDQISEKDTMTLYELHELEKKYGICLTEDDD